MHGDSESLQLFIDESREHLTGIEEDLLAIEQGGANAPAAIVDKVFRAIHTIKGSASFFAFTNIKNLSHAMENVLGKIRSLQLLPTSQIVTVLLDGADALRSMIDDIPNAENIVITSFVNKLESFLGDVKKDDTIVKTQTSRVDIDLIKGMLRFIAPGTNIPFDVNIAKIFVVQQLKDGRFVFLLEIDTTVDKIAINKDESEILGPIREIAQVVEIKRLPSDDVNARYLYVLCVSSMDKSMFSECIDISVEHISQVLTGKIIKMPDGFYSLSGVTVNHLKEVVPASEDNAATKVLDDIDKNNVDKKNHQKKNDGVQSGTTEKKNSMPTHETSLRVNITTLDKLMTLAGEMVLTRNELLQNASSKNLPKILVASQRVDTITSELQEAIMSTRMQSIGIVLSKFRRVVRDLAGQLNKKINLEIDGEDVELDKSIIEAVGDPLTHIVRNAIDHGIESPDVRQAAGKDPQGTLSIRACHEAGQVMIEIVDDGKGIDPDVIRKKARKLGFYDDATLANMSDREVINIVFRPGFSTADTVTDLSGRGVGMDVVMNSLKKVGGAVDLDSIVGKGTTIRIKLPLTLAIIPALLVIVEDKRFAIPQANVVELVRIAASDVKRKIEMVGDAAVLRLRGELLPLVRISDVLGITERTFTNTTTGFSGNERRSNIADRRTLTDGEIADEKRVQSDDRRKSPFSAVSVVVVSAGDFKYGMIVDALLDSLEIVVKPLGYHLCDCREYAGATILGDGLVALILDVVGIRRLLDMKGNCDALDEKRNKLIENANVRKDSQPFLIVKNHEEELFAIPVGLISRIEKIREDAVKNTGGKQVVQYRGTTLRLFSIDEFAHAKPRTIKKHAYAIVFQIAGREVGIIVSEIIDTVDIAGTDIDNLTHIQTGIIGSTIFQDSITLILDIFGIVKACAPELTRSSQDDSAGMSKGRILIVEDSSFFLQQIKAFMEDAGYDTICAEDGIKGLAVLKNSKLSIDMVLTDIEMPNMNGLDFTRAIRADSAFKDLPVIAVTSVTGEKAEKNGLDAGINEYLIKLDRQTILNACTRYLEAGVKEHI